MPRNKCVVRAQRVCIAKPGPVISILTQVAIYRYGQQDVPQFIAPTAKLTLPNPLGGSGEFDLAAKRIEDAIQKGEKILLFGDYDCDGVVSTVLMYELLRTKASPERLAWFIPHRIRHGYGLTTQAIEECCPIHQPDLIIAMDCGSVEYDTAEILAARNIDLVVIDHHACKRRQPRAKAHINPHPCPVSHADAILLCASALVFFVCDLLVKRWAPLAWNRERALILTGLATCVDVMKMVGLNRNLVRISLSLAAPEANTFPRKALLKVPQLATLLEVAKPTAVGYVDEGVYGQVLGPCLNACGRMGHAKNSVNLLLTHDPKRVKTLAGACNKLNNMRRLVELQNTEEAIREARIQFENKHKVLFLMNQDWHPGVVGIVATRVRDMFYRPAIVCTRVNGVWRGSGRSIPGFHMGNVFAEAKANKVISGGGGHPKAGGLSFFDEQVDSLSKHLADSFRIDDAALFPKEEVLGEITEHGVEEWHQIMWRLSPFGEGNERPLIIVDHAELVDKPSAITCVGDGKRKASNEKLQWLLDNANLGEGLSKKIEGYIQPKAAATPKAKTATSGAKATGKTVETERRVEVIGLKGLFKVRVDGKFQEYFFVVRQWWHHKDLWVPNQICAMEIRPWSYRQRKQKGRPDPKDNHEFQIYRWWCPENDDPVKCSRVGANVQESGG